MSTRDRLLLAIGETVRLRRNSPSNTPPIRFLAGTLTEVRRTRCTIDFGCGEIWSVPVADVLPPGVVDSLPGQAEFTFTR